MSKTKRASTGPKKAEPKKADELASVRKMLRAMDTKLNVCVNRTEDIMKSLDCHWSRREDHNTWLQPKVAETWHAVKRLESRLPAPAEPKEEWVPKAGDRVTFPGTKYPPLVAGEVTNVEVRYSGQTLLTVDWAPVPSKNTHWASEVRPATPAEIADHQRKMQEASKKAAEEAEAAKPIGFGTRVEYQDDKGWRVAIPFPDDGGDYMLVREVKPVSVHACGFICDYAKRHDFKVID